MIALQPGHLLLIILAAVIFFAPSRIPLVARSMRKMVSEFRKEASDKHRP